MRTRWIEVSVGLFMLLGLLAILGLAINVSGLSLNSAAQDTYRLEARFENIGGLKARSKVTLSGVQVGEVSRITIDTKRLVALVEMNINSSVDYLSKDTSAQILTSGLLGEQYIGLSVGFEPDTLKNGDTIADTQSAMVLENLIGKFLFNKVSE
ncbi:outer membrane lipid asymmetry maintenance protein MlaD [Neptunomonas phycophila]|jgi:phospholipid/cholesterol/gamma-HCH transport system substrate-binding protein|uniref:Outer membrane lipid asymmetry maintenance protein MlaD n=1 Tax=Neptunomonas phycophila TaxID=1572645 RepID=A0AAW7XH40_9GAMM|nr:MULTISPECIES: outer membrane lipid asymmetry maintenance protein MlaD [Neptunomonas]MBT3146911.1 outer membrane lipid asymmetry maintenance protein MlaD [Neptunomonas phycophila]MDN2661349.1 outer membrane lipid asymmetry maintenance protein MlaD [Neptunomonas sp. CHC150]MDO6452703.1 outer membrane lipid asymmetry maintenance protein MlaD [Neptunomonas phycophila]MDO6783630.1 outer membrane lipid asymmetry maintenance protein MlaD [Neptunomonas phycophila]MDP2521660.1 outer membrane lipid a